jgi:hypothetical protein
MKSDGFVFRRTHGMPGKRNDSATVILADHLGDHRGPAQGRVLILFPGEAEVLPKDSRVAAREFKNTIAVTRYGVRKVVLAAEYAVTGNGIDFMQQGTGLRCCILVYRKGIRRLRP